MKKIREARIKAQAWQKVKDKLGTVNGKEAEELCKKELEELEKEEPKWHQNPQEQN